MVDDVSGPGMVSTQIVTQMLRQAVADDAVSQILLDIDSPGGSVYGVSELGDAILSARARKPVVAIANSLAASAAYWIGSQAGEFYVTSGGEVGSIGVWQAHQDYSKAMDEAGVKTTLISAGKFKVEGNPYAPLDEEAQGFMQSRVDDYYAAFTKAVAKGRGVPITQVRDGMGQGRVLGADAALAQNMVDGIASFDQVLSKMHKDAASSAKTSPPAKPKTSRLAQARSELGIL
jgi:signal peptide peptidase SppA